MDYTFQFTFFNDIKGNADGKIEITLPPEYAVCDHLELFWGNSRGILPDYSAVCRIKIADLKAEYTFLHGRMIPEEATCIYAYADCETFRPWKSCCDIKYTLPKEKLSDKKEALYSFGIISDVHFTGPFWNCDRNRAIAYSDLNALKPRHIIVSGDLTDAGQLWQMRAATESFKTAFCGTPVLISTGNHEYHTYVKDYLPEKEKTEEYFGAYIKELNSEYNFNIKYENRRCYYDVYIHNIHYIFLNCSDTDNRHELGDFQRKWLDDMLSESKRKKTVSIVVNHMAIRGTSGLDCAKGALYMKDNDETEKILTSYENVIFISGHTHFNLDFDDDNVCRKNGVTYIDASCTNWTSMGISKSWGDTAYNKDSSMGFLVDVYTDKMVFRGRDFIKRRFIPRALHKVATVTTLGL